MQIQMRGITKRFGATTACDGVDFQVDAGEVMVLLGENGAGKSTLMKILYGFYRSDAGEILIDGKPVAIRSPRQAMQNRIGMVFQRFSLFPALTVRENLALANPRLPWFVGRGARGFAGALGKLSRIAPEVDPGQRVDSLSVGQTQLVELAKALNLDARLVILDEPTATLTMDEAKRLWALTRELAGQGMSVVLITHKLADVAACADRVTVMRQGRVVATASANSCTPEGLVKMTMGERRIADPEPVNAFDRSVPRVWIKAVGAAGPAGGISGIDLKLAKGEVLGIAGVSGNGQNLLTDVLAGITPLDAGEVIVDGEVALAPRMRTDGQRPIASIPEQPLRNGAAPDLSASVNLFLKRIRSLGAIPDRKSMARESLQLMIRFDVRPLDPDLRADAFSGGNLQKLIVARELRDRPAFIVASYPTMGLDYAAAAMVCEQMFECVRDGTALLWISEDLDQLMRYAHRIAVMYRGRIAGVVDASQATREQIGAWMTGSAEAAEVAA